MILVVVIVLGIVALVVGAVTVLRSRDVAAADPGRTRSEGAALLILGIVFIGYGAVFTNFGWLPIGVVFLGVGARQMRAARQTGDH